jgi:hypothetical protein
MRRAVFVAIVLLAGASTASAQTDAPVEVEPSQIAKRPDLIGHEIVVDGRVRLFLPTAGKGFDEILLKGTETANGMDISFLLPEGLRYPASPRGKSIRVRGILRRDGDRWVVHVTAKPDLYLDDMKRIERGVSILLPDDAEGRSAWADWAKRRAKTYQDDSLMATAEALHAEAIDLEFRRPANRTAPGLIALAGKARAKGVAEPEPSALAHLSFRLRLASAKTAEDFDRLAADILAFLPRAKNRSYGDSGLALDEYNRDPSSAYRKAEDSTRSALDRRLYSDAVVESYRVRSASADPKTLQDLSDEARSRIPDRPEVSNDLMRRSLDSGAEAVTTLHKNEMLKLAQNLRDAKQPERADRVIRTWLDHQRTRQLSPTDASGRVDLAEDYLSLLKDKATAADLLREAIKIDETVRPTTDLRFQKMGFVRAGEDWKDPNAPATVAASVASTPSPSTKDEPLFGLSPAEVKAQLGEPKRMSRVATQGRISLQWSYEGARGTTYIDFLQRAGDAQPAVIGRYATH